MSAKSTHSFFCDGGNRPLVVVLETPPHIVYNVHNR